ncbi:RimK/LysX family protein [Microbulbifer sp. CAU 1566]|uniref:ATP-dependent zinc protease family protein n=1 Tax=Microbulbifer sp. CAU 1566 TaxID=2933269 RepID=UPI0020042110|nr:RimK/LysX family protein [Microbulbifer sp. CAU 1566]MCK7598223.1 RimK/LysX family protein [Microbulbifer sp. CAU 1566]
MRFLPLVCSLLVAQLLAGCQNLPDIGAGTPATDESPTLTTADFDPSLCPAAETVVCAEPEVKVVERVIERNFEKVVEVPVAKDKLVLGSEELFTVEPGGVRLRALVDTGAATCSLSVLDLTPFERDGSEWVRFKLGDGSDVEPVNVELPIKRHVRVARPGFDRQRRPIVDMSLTVGEVTHMVEVNLIERGEFEFPLLVGRNFLKDAAVVDVSRKQVQGKPQLPAFSK